MYKLIKTKITGFDDREDSPIGVNANYRTTMGYDSATETIDVKVEKVIRPDLTREEATEIQYELVDERSFIKADFNQTKDNMAWQVDFDVKTEKILEPLDVYAYTSTIATGSLFHRVMWRKIKERYSDQLLPLFTVDSFYKEAEGFSLCTLQFYVADTEGSVSDTILNNSNVELMTQAEKIFHQASNVDTKVSYVIYDSNDQLLSSPAPTITSPHKQDALSERPGVDPIAISGNQFRVSLPNSSSYKIKAIFSRGITDKQVSNTFDVTCINGVVNKTRLTSGFKEGGPTSFPGFVRPGVDGTTPRFCGVENLTLTTTDLSAGDFVKLKLSVGDFYSYSELWIDII
jgi:hypothetical protein